MHEFRSMLEQGCYDIVMPEVQVLGVTTSLDVASLAAAYNRQVSPHGSPGDRLLATIIAFHMVASWPHAQIAEVIHEPPIGDVNNGWSIFENPPVLGPDGFIQMPEGPGLGMTVKPELIERD